MLPKHRERKKMLKGWAKITIGELVQVNPENIGVHTSENYEFGYIDLSMVNEGKIEYPLEKIRYKDASPRARRIVKKGDILFSTVRPNLRGFGRVTNDLNDLICSTGFAVLRCKEKTTIEYLYQYIFSDLIYRQIDALVVGSNYPAINSHDVHNLQVIIPESLEEQRKIAAILRTWDDAIEKVERLIRKKEVQKSELAQRLLTGKIRLLGEIIQWQSINLGDCCIGKASYGANAPSVDFSILLPRYVRITDISENGILSEQDPKSIPVDAAKGNYLEKGDIVFARSGATAGKTYLHQSNDVLAYAGYLIRFKPNINIIIPEYLFLYTQSEQYKVWIKNNIRSGTQPNINAQEYSSITLCLPSINEQRQIAEIIYVWIEVISKLEQYKQTLMLQKRGLMQKLLTGKWQIRTGEMEK